MKSIVLIALLIGLSLCGRPSAKRTKASKDSIYVQVHKTPTSNQVQMQTVTIDSDEKWKKIAHANQKRYIRGIRLKHMNNDRQIGNNGKYKNIYWNKKKGRRIDYINKDAIITKIIRSKLSAKK